MDENTTNEGEEQKNDSGTEKETTTEDTASDSDETASE